jgi:hypothetical protein
VYVHNPVDCRTRESYHRKLSPRLLCIATSHKATPSPEPRCLKNGAVIFCNSRHQQTNCLQLITHLPARVITSQFITAAGRAALHGDRCAQAKTIAHFIWKQSCKVGYWHMSPVLWTRCLEGCARNPDGNSPSKNTVGPASTDVCLHHAKQTAAGPRLEMTSVSGCVGAPGNCHISGTRHRQGRPEHQQ